MYTEEAAGEKQREIAHFLHTHLLVKRETLAILFLIQGKAAL